MAMNWLDRALSANSLAIMARHSASRNISWRVTAKKAKKAKKISGFKVLHFGAALLYE
jgi:hypothetical protein